MSHFPVHKHNFRASDREVYSAASFHFSAFPEFNMSPLGGTYRMEFCASKWEREGVFSRLGQGEWGLFGNFTVFSCEELFQVLPILFVTCAIT